MFFIGQEDKENQMFCVGQGHGQGKKHKKAILQINVPENFVPGACNECPLGSHSSLQRPFYNSCFLGYIPKGCPICIEENG